MVFILVRLDIVLQIDFDLWRHFGPDVLQEQARNHGDDPEGD